MLSAFSEPPGDPVLLLPPKYLIMQSLSFDLLEASEGRVGEVLDDLEKSHEGGKEQVGHRPDASLQKGVGPRVRVKLAIL